MTTSSARGHPEDGERIDGTLWVALGDLQICQVTLRRIQESRSLALSKVLDFRALGVLHVAERVGATGYWVIDGQHRHRALQHYFGDRWEAERVECKLHGALTDADVAALSLTLNDSRSIRPVDRFRASVVAGEEEAVAISRILERRSLACTDEPRPHGVTAVTALQQVYRGGSPKSRDAHPETLDDTLGVLTDAWGTGAPDGIDGLAIQIVGLLLVRYGAGVDLSRLTTKLAELRGGAPGLRRRAKTYQGVLASRLDESGAAYLVTHYNSGLRNASRLSPWL
jgi:hypothetical protein